MILAREQNADLVIMDDNAAKKTAKFLGLNVTGTLGILLKAKMEGYLEMVEPGVRAEESWHYSPNSKIRIRD